MGELVRIVTNVSDDPKPHPLGFCRPEAGSKKPNSKNQIFREQDFNTKANPERYKLALLSDPGLMMLRARNLPSKDQEKVKLSLLERFIYEMEKED